MESENRKQWRQICIFKIKQNKKEKSGNELNGKRKANAANAILVSANSLWLPKIEIDDEITSNWNETIQEKNMNSYNFLIEEILRIIFEEKN